MKIDLYTKSMLTIIAVGIVALVIQNFTKPAEAQFGGVDKVALYHKDGDMRIGVKRNKANPGLGYLNVVDDIASNQRVTISNQLEFLNKQIGMLVVGR